MVKLKYLYFIHFKYLIQRKYITHYITLFEFWYCNCEKLHFQIKPFTAEFLHCKLQNISLEQTISMLTVFSSNRCLLHNAIGRWCVWRRADNIMIGKRTICTSNISAKTPLNGWYLHIFLQYIYTFKLILCHFVIVM